MSTYLCLTGALHLGSSEVQPPDVLLGVIDDGVGFKVSRLEEYGTITARLVVRVSEIFFSDQLLIPGKRRRSSRRHNSPSKLTCDYMTVLTLHVNCVLTSIFVLSYKSLYNTVLMLLLLLKLIIFKSYVQPNCTACGCNNNATFSEKIYFQVSYRRRMPATLAQASVTYMPKWQDDIVEFFMFHT